MEQVDDGRGPEHFVYIFAYVSFQDDYGNVQGEYRVALPDGRTQIVTYHADNEGGFIADVKYEGVPQYPPAPKGGYGPYKPAAPKYAPPPPKYAPA